MTPVEYAIVTATCAVLVAAVFTDVRDSKIYNAVTVPFAIVGIILSTINHGLTGALGSLGGIAIGLALFFVSGFLGRILGAGDCKLFAAVGAIIGPGLLLWAIACSAIAGGVFAVAIALWRGVLQRAFRAVWQAVYLRLYMKTPMDIATSDQRMRLPYAVAICAGTLWVLWHHYGVA